MRERLYPLFIRHKVWIISLAVVAVGGGSVVWYRSAFATTETVRYVLASVERGAVVSTVSGSGQVSTAYTMEVKPKASGAITSLTAVLGQKITPTTTLAKIDTRDVMRTIRDAELSLQSAQVSYDKFKQPPDTLSRTEAEHAVAQAKEDLKTLLLTQAENRQKLEDQKQEAILTENETYEEGFSAVTDAFLDLPSVISGLKDILYSSSIDSRSNNIDWYANQVNLTNPEVVMYRTDVATAYERVRVLYDEILARFKTMNRASAVPAETERLINDTYKLTQFTADALKTTHTYIDFVDDIIRKPGFSTAVPAIIKTHISQLDSFTSTNNSHVTKLLSLQKTIKQAGQTLRDAESALSKLAVTEPLAKTQAERRIAERELSLAKLTTPPDPLDVRSQELTLTSRRNALRDARAELANYTITSPVAGKIASVSIKKGESVSAGTVAFTVVSDQYTAAITLNEVDVAQVKVGQKATLSFDAIDGVTITGKVTEIDPIGTVSQGVVSYGVTMSFDTNDARIKNGMSVSAQIITSLKNDVITVPAAAVKSFGEERYVEVVDNPPAGTNLQGVELSEAPRQVPVTTGLDNGEVVEITSGLTEGMTIVSRTIVPTTASSAAPANRQQSVLPFGTGASGATRAFTTGGTGGNAIRFQAR